MRSRTFFYSGNGTIGLPAWTVQPDDVVVVLFGSRVPFVLRRVERSYRLVSDCFISGYMDGEAMQLMKDGKLDVEDFEIR